MSLVDRQQFKYDIGLEIARMGAFYWTNENPYTVTFWDILPVDEGLNEAKLMERVIFIERVDHLIQMLYAKHAAVMTSSMPVSPLLQPNLDTEGSPPQ